MKNLMGTVCLFFLVALVQTGNVSAGEKMIEVKITNLSAKVVLTPPIVAASKGKIRIFQLTKPASKALEMLAEGGNTDELAMMFEKHHASVAQATEPILPGQTLTLYVYGHRYSRISVASMILPSNDGFVAMNSKRINPYGKTTTFLSAYDAGTEWNDEDCTHIPGPLSCGGGQGYSEPSVDDEGFVYPHPGTHGENGISVEEFSWADPVAKVTTRFGIF
jgi:Spondin_N